MYYYSDSNGAMQNSHLIGFKHLLHSKYCLGLWSLRSGYQRCKQIHTETQLVHVKSLGKSFVYNSVEVWKMRAR